mmetsp:Transcript_49640/g.124502  ORF Transcript_49640/g.124502 Transcript_49640/m.124502 type:complete len:160 (+) Transcript_49640:161-640(+)
MAQTNQTRHNRTYHTHYQYSKAPSLLLQEGVTTKGDVKTNETLIRDTHTRHSHLINNINKAHAFRRSRHAPLHPHVCSRLRVCPFYSSAQAPPQRRPREKLRLPAARRLYLAPWACQSMPIGSIHHASTSSAVKSFSPARVSVLSPSWPKGNTPSSKQL